VICLIRKRQSFFSSFILASEEDNEIVNWVNFDAVLLNASLVLQLISYASFLSFVKKLQGKAQFSSLVEGETFSMN
jgi:hypothetical protein